jgi:hypothetical protein
MFSEGFSDLEKMFSEGGCAAHLVRYNRTAADSNGRLVHFF